MGPWGGVRAPEEGPEGHWYYEGRKGKNRASVTGEGRGVTQRESKEEELSDRMFEKAMPFYKLT